MIFDNDKVTGLVLDWQGNHDPVLMEEILDQCRSLIEVIVSYFDPIYREDLIQEAYLKLHKAIDYYNPEVSSLHNYLTTVIKNMCISYVEKQDNEPDIDVDLVEIGKSDRHYYDDDLLTELITRNRSRFSSLPVDFIDDVTEYIYHALRNGVRYRQIMGDVETRFMCHKKIAYTIYSSILIFLRIKFAGYANVSDHCDEMSILPDLKEILGECNYRVVAIALSGMSIRLP